MTFVRFLLTFLLAAAGGWVFFQFQFPLAWMLGAMTICMLGALLKAPLQSPPSMLVLPMATLLGSMLGSGFTPEIVGQLDRWLLSMAVLVLFVVVAGLIAVLFLRKVAGFDLPTAYFSAMPGGLTEMILIGEEKGGDARRIALAHASRIFLVVFTLPLIIMLMGYSPEIGERQGSANSVLSTPPEDWLWLALCMAGGVLVGKVARIPAPYLIGPMLVSAAVHGAGLTDFKPPAELVNLAQIVFGAAVGCRFLGTEPGEILRGIAYSVGSTGLVLGLTLIFAFGLGSFSGYGVLPLILAYSPGGLLEMSLVGLALDVEVSFVAAHHLVRVFAVMLVAPYVFALIERLAGGKRE